MKRLVVIIGDAIEASGVAKSSSSVPSKTKFVKQIVPKSGAESQAFAILNALRNAQPQPQEPIANRGRLDEEQRYIHQQHEDEFVILRPKAKNRLHRWILKLGVHVLNFCERVGSQSEQHNPRWQQYVQQHFQQSLSWSHHPEQAKHIVKQVLERANRQDSKQFEKLHVVILSAGSASLGPAKGFRALLENTWQPSKLEKTQTTRPFQTTLVQILYPRCILRGIDILVTPQHDIIPLNHQTDDVTTIRTMGALVNSSAQQIKPLNPQSRPKQLTVTILVGGPRYKVPQWIARRYQTNILNLLETLFDRLVERKLILRENPSLSGIQDVTIKIFSSHRSGKDLEDGIEEVAATYNAALKPGHPSVIQDPIFQAARVIQVFTPKHTEADPTLYFTTISNSQIVLITDDSVSMIGEALMFPGRKYILQPYSSWTSSNRFRNFLDKLQSTGQIQRIISNRNLGSLNEIVDWCTVDQEKLLLDWSRTLTQKTAMRKQNEVAVESIVQAIKMREKD